MAQPVTKRTLQRSLPRLFIVGISVFVFGVSCAADNDEPFVHLDSAAHDMQPFQFVNPEFSTPASRSLLAAFPEHADRVLGTMLPHRFVSSDRGFVVESKKSLALHLEVELPKRSIGPLLFTAPGGHRISVHPLGVEGDGEFAGRAIAYRRARGTSFWTVSSGGAEEWLHFEAGAVMSDLDVAAEWEIEGATPILMNGAIALMDDDGNARAWVTAPEAYTAERGPVDLRLAVEGQRIQIFADAQGEELLLDPAWIAVAPVPSGYYGATATTLLDGRVLFANGYNGLTIPTGTNIYNPVTNVWTAAAAMNKGRYVPGAVRLNDGRVFVAGGQSDSAYEASTEIYNPVTNAWTNGPNMSAPRALATAVVLADGRVLVPGGYTGASFTNNAQIYNPMTNTWTTGGTMITPRAWTAGALLPDGRVLIAGGINTSIMAPNALGSAEIYNPMTNSWSSAGSMLAPRYLFNLHVLGNGRVIAAGGIGSNGEGMATTDLYDPMTNSWTATAALPTEMGAQATAVLGTGELVSASGYGIGVTNSTSAMYDSATASWSNTGSVSIGRYFGATVQLANGEVLFVSGTTDGMAVTAAVDRFSNSSLSNGSSCQTDGECSSGFCADGVCCDTACNAGSCDACSIASGASVDGTCALLTGNACNDGNACTQTDSCQTGICVGSNPITCTALNQCYSAGVCDPSTGMCSNPVKANGTSCDDNNGCTQTDSCQNGSCTGSNPVVCFAMSQCHTIGTCNPGTGECSNPKKPDGTACSDGSACTDMDTCQSGACIGANPIKCVASDQCHDVGTCNPSTGVCSNPAKMNGALCDDGNACTQVDTCQSGACTGAMPKVCTALDQCHTAGFCDAISGNCSNPNKPNGSTCNDGDACTQKDTCNAGTCTGGNPVICTAMDQCHDAGTCDSATGICSNPMKNDGEACDDADKCTQSDTCLAGACTGSNPITCSAPDQCHDEGTCDPTTGMCSNPNKNDGVACSDDNACTQDDSCQAGVCTGATSVTCTAQDECHDVGTCDSTNGMCSNPVKADGSPCTGGVCQNGECKTDGGVGGSMSNSSSSTGGSGGGSTTDPGGCGCRIDDSSDSRSISTLAGMAVAAIVALRRRRQEIPKPRQTLNSKRA